MIDWDAQPLGTVTDTEIAKCLGVSTQAVQKARTRRGIASATSAERVDWDGFEWGSLTDGQVARVTGVGVKGVASARARRGIPRAKYRAKKMRETEV